MLRILSATSVTPVRRQSPDSATLFDNVALYCKYQIWITIMYSGV